MGPDDGRPIDVAHVSYGGLGGHGAIVRMLTAQLSPRGLRSSVILLAPIDELDDDPDHWPLLDDVVAVPRGGKLDLAALVAVARAIRRQRPTVVLCHTHQPIPAVFVGQLLARRRPQVVIVEHQSIVLRRKAENVRSAIALPFCRAVVVLSDGYARRYPLRRWPLPAVRRLTVIPNGIDAARFSRVDRSLDAPGDPDTFTVGMGCRMIPIKDLASLVDAVAALRDRPGPARRSRMAGDGPTRDSLEAQVAQRGLGDAVEFTGSLDENEMLRFYASLDLYVQATLGETSSISLLEAYACGLAVVASDVDGVSGFVRDGDDGVLVPVRDPAALAEAIDQLRADPERRIRLGAAARHRVETESSAATMADHYLELFAGLGAAVVPRPAGG